MGREKKAEPPIDRHREKTIGCVRNLLAARRQFRDRGGRGQRDDGWEDKLVSWKLVLADRFLRALVYRALGFEWKLRASDDGA